jgi:hypothetical protein
LVYPHLLLAVHFYFLIEYLIRLYTAKNFLTYLISTESIIEIVACIPFLIVTLSVRDNRNFYCFFFRMADLCRLLSLYRLTNYIENDINRDLSNIVIGVLAFVICFTGYIQMVENYMQKCDLDLIKDCTTCNFDLCKDVYGNLFR